MGVDLVGVDLMKVDLVRTHPSELNYLLCMYPCIIA